MILLALQEKVQCRFCGWATIAHTVSSIFKIIWICWFEEHFLSYNMMIYSFTWNEAISLVVSAMGSQIYNPDSIFTTVEIFSFGSVTFSLFLRIFYLYACLVATAQLIYTLFISPCICEQVRGRRSYKLKVYI